MNYEIIPTVQVGGESDDLTVAIMYSPFEPEKRDVGKVIYQQGQPLSAYLEGLPEKDDWLIYVNGEIVPNTMWESYIPQPRDMVTLVANVFGGGGDDKGILRVVAMVVVAVAAAYTGGAAATALVESGTLVAGGTGATLVSGVVGAVVSVAGGMLVNALLPMPEMDAGSGSGESGRSQTYGFGKPTTGRGQGGSVPIIYGEHSTGGSMIALDRSLDPDTNDELLSIKLAVSEGEIYDIREVKINDQPIDSYENVSWGYTNGALSEAVSSEFCDSIRIPLDVSRKVDTTPISVELPVGSTSAELMLSLPQGLVQRYEDKNDKDPYAIDLSIRSGVKGFSLSPSNVGSQALAWESEYSDPRNSRTRAEIRLAATGGYYRGNLYFYRQKADSSNWEHIGTRTFNGNATWDQTFYANFDSSEQDGRYRYRYRLDNAYNLRVVTAELFQSIGGILRIEDCTHDSKRVMISVPLTTAIHNDTYIVEISRKEAESDSDYIRDELWLNEVEAVSSTQVSHRGTACMRITMKATDQLSGMPSVLCKVRGVKVKTYDRSGKQTGFGWSNNPAWIALDILLRWSNVPHSLIDFSSFVDLAIFCNNNNLTFNGIFDSTSNSWDSVQKVLRAGLAQVNPVGAKISLIIHQPRDAVMMFNSSNMIKGSFSSSWTSSQDRSNVFEAEYYEQSADNASAIVKIADLEELAKGYPVRETKMSLMGVTNRSQAEKILGVYRASNKFVTMSVSFDAYLDAIACTVGDAVIVQSDHINWGKSFRVPRQSNNRSAIYCDLSPEDIEKYARNVLVHYPIMEIGTGRLDTVHGTKITMYLPSLPINKIHALRVGKKDYHVTARYESGGKLHLEVAENGLAVGDTVRFIQFDYMFRSAVSDISLEHGIIYTVAEMPVSPPHDALVSLGVNENAGKKFIITSIKGDGDFARSISAIEYNESLFYLNGDYDYEEPVNPLKPLSAVRDLKVVEEIYKDGLTTLTRAVVSWTKPAQGAYRNALLEINAAGRSLRVKSVVGMDRYLIEDLKDGDLVTATVKPIDQGGIVSPIGVNIRHVIQGTLAPPSTVRGFNLQRTYSGLEAKWRINPEPDVVGYQLREGDVWDNGKVVVERTDTTVANIPRTIAGVYQVMIKAIDVNGTFSKEAAFSDIEIFGPEPVSGFTAIQNDRMVILRWDRHPNPDVTSYIIRRGVSYNNSEHLADVSGNSYTIDADAIDIEEYFWAVAVDRFGVASATPAFAKITTNPLEDYNVINKVNISLDGWKGDRVNFIVDAEGSIIGDTDQSYCEYFHNVETGTPVASRILLRDYPFAQEGDATWQSFDEVSWAEADNIFWVPFGMADGQSYERDISRQLRAIPAEMSESYDCATIPELTAGVKGSVATLEGVTTHAPVMLRGGTKGVGISGGKVTMPLGSPIGVSQLYISAAIVGETRFVATSNGIDVGFTVTPKLEIGEYHIAVDGGGILIVSAGIGSTQVQNRVLNFVIRKRRDACVFSVNLHGNANSSTTEFASDIHSFFEQLTISTAESDKAQCYVRIVRQEQMIEISGDTQTAQFLNRFSRRANFGRFERYSAGFYEADSVDVRLSMSITSLSITPGISSSTAIVDMPDVIDRGFLNIDVDDNVPVKFNRRFTVPPRVIPQFGGSIGAIPETAISVFAMDITTENFYVAAYDGMGNRVRGMINWQASGY